MRRLVSRSPPASAERGPAPGPAPGGRPPGHAPCPLHQPQLIDPRQGGLIQAAMAVHHHRSLQPQPREGIGHRLQQLRFGHPQHLRFRPHGIHQRAEQVEDGAHPQAPTHGGKFHQRRMPARGKQEGDPAAGQGGHNRIEISFEVEADRFEHIGRAHLAAGAAVAVLGHRRATGSRHERHGRGDVEGVGPVAAGAAGVDQLQGRALTGQAGCLPQHPCHRRQFLAAQPLAAQGRQQGTGEFGLQAPRQPALHQGRCLRLRERLALQQLLQQGGPGGGAAIGVRGR